MLLPIFHNGVLKTIDRMPTNMVASQVGAPASHLYRAPMTVNEGVPREAIIEHCRIELLAPLALLHECRPSAQGPAPARDPPAGHKRCTAPQPCKVADQGESQRAITAVPPLRHVPGPSTIADGLL